MEGDLPLSSNTMQGWPSGFPELHGSMQLQDLQNSYAYPYVQETNQLSSVVDFNKAEEREGLVTGVNMMTYAEKGSLEKNEVGNNKEMPSWQRVRWTKSMVKLLITTLSYVWDDASTDCIISRKKKAFLLRRIGKWRCVSKVMVEKGCHVSPQQCEDKFNNLNKSYRRLNELLGKGTSCKVVANPELLETMNIPEKAKQDARRILSSKHLFFEEMCSYHNHNRNCLPHDPHLLSCLQSVLESRDYYEPPDSTLSMIDSFDEEAGGSAQGGTNGDTVAKFGFLDFSAELSTEMNGKGNAGFSRLAKLNPSCPEGSNACWSAAQWEAYRSWRLEKQKLQIRAKVLELEKQQFKWQLFNQEQDLELEKMRLENRCLKLDNVSKAAELKRRKNGEE